MKNIFETYKLFIIQYKLETALIGIAIITALLSLTLFLTAPGKSHVDAYIKEDKPVETHIQQPSVVVDVQGAVIKPGVYAVHANSRIDDVIKLAGGLSEVADKKYVYRYFNFAQVLSDQEKIYIPSVDETVSITSEHNTIDSFVNTVVEPQNEIQAGKININSSSLAEIMTLPGVGKSTADKIIASRPYNLLDDLITRNILKEKAFNAIKSLITY